MFILGAPQVLSRSQRRGAIIILGMLALSKRTIISEKVDTLLKIGLGSFGKVSASQYSIDIKRSPYSRPISLLQGTRVLPCNA
jgi:hypothetical protein